MPFGLKNVGVTYRHSVNTIFKNQNGRTMKVYIDDMIIKSLTAANHVELLLKYKIRLNLEKYALEIMPRKFMCSWCNRRVLKPTPTKLYQY